jgi:hypothetical protein
MRPNQGILTVLPVGIYVFGTEKKDALDKMG